MKYQKTYSDYRNKKEFNQSVETIKQYIIFLLIASGSILLWETAQAFNNYIINYLINAKI